MVRSRPPPIPLNNVYGTAGDDNPASKALEGNDFIYAGAGDDIIIAGHGGGDDFYDGDGDNNQGFAGQASTRSSSQARTASPLSFAGLPTSTRLTARPPATTCSSTSRGSSAARGDDVFNLYTNDSWEIDGGSDLLGAFDDFDILRLVGDLDIRSGSGPDVYNVEMVDLNTTGSNTVDIDIDGVHDMNDAHTLRVTGGATDFIYITDEEISAGQWVLVEQGHVFNDAYTGAIAFDKYVFVSGDNTIATVYLQQNIDFDLIEHVTVEVATPNGYDLGSDQLYADMANAEVDSYSASATQFTAYNGESGLYFVVTGSGLAYDTDFEDHFFITGGFITGIKKFTGESEDLLVEATGFNFDAAQFNAALNAYRDSGFTDTSGLDAIFENVTYDFTGNDGADHFEGGAFTDKFNGAGGGDTLTGNEGADTFVAHGAGHTTITDFSINGGDRIDVSGFPSPHHMTQIGPLAHPTGVDEDHPLGTGTVIDFGNGDVLTLPGVILNNLSDNDFIFVEGPSAPVLDLDANDSSGATGSDYQTAITFNAPTAVLDSDATITEASNVSSATILLTGAGYNGFTDYPNTQLSIRADLLEGATFVENVWSWHGISWTASGGSSGMTVNITGSGTSADYLEILHAARMSFDSDTSNTSANVTITVTGAGGSDTATTVVDIPNRAPVINVFGFIGDSDSATDSRVRSAALRVRYADSHRHRSGPSLVLGDGHHRRRHLGPS